MAIDQEKGKKGTFLVQFSISNDQSSRDAIESKSPLPFYVVQKGEHFDAIEKNLDKKGINERTNE